MKDKYFIFTIIIAAVCTALGILLNFTEGFTWEHITHLAVAVIYLILALIFQEKIVFFYLVALSVVTSYSLPMSNILPWFFCCIAILIRPKHKWNLLVMYGINTFFECILIDKKLLPLHTTNYHGVLHLTYHIVLVLFFFSSIEHFLKNRYVKKELNLTDDERLILDELEKEKMIKNCRSFSKNTITAKLKDARERNGIDSNAELLAQYKMSNHS